MNSLRCVAYMLVGVVAILAATPSPAKTVTYYYTDHLGSVLATTDGSGNLTSQSDYRSFGAAVMGEPRSGPGYTSHVGDTETDLVYMQARYYDPAAGRFLSTDPIAPTAGDVFNSNRFAYGSNNPLRYSDPTGKCAPCLAPEVVAAGGLAVAVGSYYAAGMIVQQINSQQPVIIVLNEGYSSPEAKEKVFEGTVPAAGASGAKGEREGVPGGEGAAWDKIDGSETTAPNGTKIKKLSDGGVADLHSSTKSQDYPQGTKTIKITDANKKIIGTVRYPAPPPPPPPPEPAK